MSNESPTTEIEKEVPIAEVRPVVRAGGLGPQLLALARYMVRTEVHTYAFSVAANVILSLFPFIVMMLTLSRQVFHSRSMETVVGQMMSTFLPSNQDFIMRNMQLLAHPHKGAQIYSIIMLLISCTGIFLPLEVALNSVWGVRQNRSYLHNQIVSLGLAFAVGILAMASVALTAGQESLLSVVFFGHTDNIVYIFLNGSMLRILAAIAGILIFFLIYWILPNRKVPARAVLPTAVVIGLLWEAAKYLYVLVLPRLDFASVYGPFQVSVGLMIWAFLSGLLVLAGAHFSATRYALSVARQDEREEALQEQREQLESGAQVSEAHAERT
jgi:YihY family inner membrane protein